MFKIGKCKTTKEKILQLPLERIDFSHLVEGLQKNKFFL